jgi:hypothetical protein
MLQVFRDCCHLHGHSGALGTRTMFWLQTVGDLACSIALEWRREIVQQRNIDYPGLADAIMVSIVVGTNLLVWGWTGASVALEVMTSGNPAANSPARTGGHGHLGLILFTVTLALLIGGISALVVARWRPVENPRIRA